MDSSNFELLNLLHTCRHLVPCPPDETLLLLPTTIVVIPNNLVVAAFVAAAGQVPGRSLDRNELPSAGVPSSSSCKRTR